MSELPEDTPRDETAAFTPNGVDPRLLEILICPVTRQPLAYDRSRNELVSKNARLAFPSGAAYPLCWKKKPATSMRIAAA